MDICSNNVVLDYPLSIFWLEILIDFYGCLLNNMVSYIWIIDYPIFNFYDF